MTWKGLDPVPINEGHKAGTPEYLAYRLLYKAWNLRQSRRCRNALGQGAGCQKTLAAATARREL